MPAGHEALHSSDAALLDFLTAPDAPSFAQQHGKQNRIKRRDADLDPLLLGAAASYQHVTRNHYCHDFFPGVMLPHAQGSWDFSNWTGEQMSKGVKDKARFTYVSRQAPRSTRQPPPPEISLATPPPTNAHTPALSRDISPARTPELTPITSPLPTPSLTTDDIAHATWQLSLSDDVQVKCMARTRVPTPHGPAFLHLYHNNRDGKEHLAIVMDSAQLGAEPMLAPAIRSRSLDAAWSADESEMDRITRGAYVGRLQPNSYTASTPASSSSGPSDAAAAAAGVPAPLVRIHSECFTGETIGSMRCDCGEQLDEALRQIAQPILLADGRTIPGRGAVVYLRQEGRGIGLLSKIRAYNLQDLGHDTVQANLLLGHGADERAYGVAGAILRDLALDTSVRLLTNNPDKVQALEEERVAVAERVPMVPRSWQRRTAPASTADGSQVRVVASGEDVEELERAGGATLIGAGAAHGDDLEKYLRTKVLRMGHMLPLSAFPVHGL